MYLFNRYLCLLFIFISPAIHAWQANIAPYLWAMNMNGDVDVGNVHAHINEKFNDLIKHFRGGGMLWLDVNNDKFGIFANALYAELSNTVTDSIYNIHAKEKFGLYTIGASYVVYRNIVNCHSKFEFLPYIGARITDINTTLDVTNVGLSASDNESWVDPIIGGRFNYYFARNWKIIGAADIGGTNFNDHKSLNLSGLIGYNPSSMSALTFYLGYRWLSQHYSTGAGVEYFLWNVKIFGPMLGVNFSL